jgi:hypothetical protein
MSSNWRRSNPFGDSTEEIYSEVDNAQPPAEEYWAGDLLREGANKSRRRIHWLNVYALVVLALALVAALHEAGCFDGGGH